MSFLLYKKINYGQRKQSTKRNKETQETKGEKIKSASGVFLLYLEKLNN